MWKQFLVSTLLALGLCSSLQGSATAQVIPNPVLRIPSSFGPGVAGNVIAASGVQPPCPAPIQCATGQPVVGASVQVISLDDDLLGPVVGTAVTNNLGNFVVSVPAGNYLVQVDPGSAFPVCPDTNVTVKGQGFAFVVIACASAMR